MTDQHIIGRFKLDVEATVEEDRGIQIQNDLSQLLEGTLRKEVEVVFDTLPADLYLRLDRLVIDLGTLDIENYQVEIAQVFRTALQKEMDRLIKSDYKREGVVVSQKDRIWEAFRSFVERGYWPWWGGKSSIDELASQLEEQIKKMGLTPSQQEIIRQWSGSGNASLNRLVLQFRASLLEILLQNIAPPRFQKWVQHQLQLQPPKMYPGIWATAFHMAVEHSTIDMRSDAMWKMLVENLLAQGVARGDVRKLNDLPKSIERPKRKEMDTDDVTLSLEGEVYVRLAGLVLAAPFLPRLFSNCNLMEGNATFKSTAHQIRAVHLLHYIATGHDEAPEHELVLCKLLCNYPFQMPVPLGVDLTGFEKEQATNLLKSLIANWEKLGNSSIENLQGAFLIREGKLEDKDKQFNLWIERKSFDMLLDFLPWTYSVVKLPWMTKMLTVNW